MLNDLKSGKEAGPDKRKNEKLNGHLPLDDKSSYVLNTLKEDVSRADTSGTGAKVTSSNVDQLLRSAYIDPNEEVSRPPICLEINEFNSPAIIGTLGNFSLIIGKAKSRKTFFCAIALAAALRNGEIIKTLRGNFPPDKKEVLYFDTEQSKYHVSKAVKRVLDLAERQNSENFRSYGLRKYSPEERLLLIEHAIVNSANLGFVVIDGIRDLVTSINDEEQATTVASKLLKWTEDYGIHILCVLHQNKGDNNARGHLGSELQNKAESVISITKSNENKDVSIVEPVFCREKEFEPFTFEIDENGLPYLSTFKVPKKENRTNQPLLPNNLEAQKHNEILHAVFEVPGPSYSKVIKRIREKLDMGENKAREFLEFYKENGFITHDGKEGTKHCRYRLSTPF